MTVHRGGIAKAKGIKALVTLIDIMKLSFMQAI